MANRIIEYFRESREELKKVIWPSRPETVRSTLIVLGVSAAVAAFLGLLDYVLNIGLERIVQR
jgi:preprotein translocase subunit SecE